MLGKAVVGSIDGFPEVTVGSGLVGLADGVEEGARVEVVKGEADGVYDGALLGKLLGGKVGGQEGGTDCSAVGPAGVAVGRGDGRPVEPAVKEGIAEGAKVGRDVNVGPVDGCPVGREDWLGSCVDGGVVGGARVGKKSDKKPALTIGNVPRSVWGLLVVGGRNSLSPNASAIVVGPGVADISGDTIEGKELGALAGLGVALGEGAGLRKRLPGRNTLEPGGTKPMGDGISSTLLFPLFK